MKTAIKKVLKFAPLKTDFDTIRFYECLHEYFQYTEKVELEFVWKVKMRDNLLGELYSYYLQTEYLSIETWSGIEELLRCYVAAVYEGYVVLEKSC